MQQDGAVEMLHKKLLEDFIYQANQSRGEGGLPEQVFSSRQMEMRDCKTVSSLKL